MTITFVKKILLDGLPCPKCREVEDRLIESGQMSLIDQVVVADERCPSSLGMQLAHQHSVEIAPFFVVNDGDAVRVYTVYLKFMRDELGVGQTDRAGEAQDMLRSNPELDFI